MPRLLKSARRGDIESGRERSNDGFWKAMAFCSFAGLMLFLTDTIELKKLTGEDIHHSSIPEPYGIDETFAHVETKPPHPAPTAAPTPGPTVAPTDAPIPNPTAAPTAKATPDPTANPTTNPTAKPEEKPQPVASPIPAVGDRHTYQTRGQPLNNIERKGMIKRWGAWTLVDKKQRPTEDYYAKYPNRDIPRSEFPKNAWQIDSEYLKEFLPEAIKLVERAQKAILAEYGHTEGTWEERAEQFELEIFETLEGTSSYIITKPEWRKDSGGDHGGWSTVKSMEGLKRRLLHAVMTEDTFIVALGGHSSAAGHGNHFVQSYSIQIQWIMEAVFARLGVKHTSGNFANGGLGTIQHGIAASSVYGPSIDMLIWDSGMTEKDDKSVEAFARQGLIGGNKVPVLWNLWNGVAKNLNMNAGIEVGGLGRATFTMKEATSLEDIKKMPFPDRYVKCDSTMNEICKNNQYIGHCWDDDRTDVVPVTKQNPFPGGRAKWHPGNRRHQAMGRALTFHLLSALKEGLKEWNETDGYNIPDESWHVTDLYETIRKKLEELGPDFGECKDNEQFELEWICKYPVKGRTEFTPRAYPSLSNIRSLMHPDMAASIPAPDRPLYNPPEVFNPDLHPPKGEIDVLNIVEAGVEFQSTLNPDYAAQYYKKPTFAKASKFKFGKGIGLDTQAGDEYCDGTADSFCGKGPKDSCLLSGQNDKRGTLIMDGYSGWTVLNIPDLKYGYIALKIDTGIGKSNNPMTENWTSENNERMLQDDSFCDDFKFEYAIDGAITSLSKGEFLERLHQVQRVVATITVLKDETYTGGVEKEVEVAFRLTGCGREKTFGLSHVYWA